MLSSRDLFCLRARIGIVYQISFNKLYCDAIRAAWNWPDIKNAPPVPLSDEEKVSYLTKIDPTSAFARALLLKVLDIRGLPLPEFLIEVEIPLFRRISRIKKKCGELPFPVCL